MEEEQEEMTDEECLRYLEWWKQTGPLLEKGEVGAEEERKKLEGMTREEKVKYARELLHRYQGKYNKKDKVKRKAETLQREKRKGSSELTIIGGVRRGSTWLAIVGGITGGLIGLAILDFNSYYFVPINTVIIGAVLGSLYVRVWKKEGKFVSIGAIIGGILGLNPISLGVFAFGAPIVLVSLWLLYEEDDLDLLMVCIVGALLCVLGGYLGWRLIPYIKYWLKKPYFVLPLLSFVGYFVGCKITEGKKPREEYLKEVPPGGLSMSENQNFPQKVTEDISPVAFSEKAMIQDLLGALNNRSLLLTKIDSWKARAKAQDQLRAFEMIKEIFQKEAEAIRAYTEAQQARLDFDNLKEFNQHIQREKLKSQLAEEKYKQAELEEKLKRMRLEEERKRLELQREIERLKRAQEITESRIERLKREELEKIDFQEEIRKIKTIKLGERAEYFHNWKKRIKEKYPPEEAEEIIDEFERMLVEEGLKEE